MPRAILAEINTNSRRGPELSPYLRGKIEALHEVGDSKQQISQTLGIARSTIRYTLQQDSLRNAGQSLLRQGRPKKYDSTDVRNVIRFVRVHPKSTYEEIRQNLHLYLSHNTLSRILDSVGIKNWKAKQRPALKPEHVRKRYTWAKVHLNWRTEWDFIIFSDECTVERGKGSQREWVFRTPTQKWDKEMIQTYHAGKDVSIMVWGAIWKGGRSDLVIMTRDEEAKRNGYTANSILDVLDDQVGIFFEPGRTFMLDNARVHTAKKVKKWFEDNGVPLFDWPPYSPDMNPIEHVWKKMKEIIHQRHPELLKMGKSEEDLRAMSSAIVEAWEAIPQQWIDNLIDSMPKRVEALRKKKGWHTKY